MPALYRLKTDALEFETVGRLEKAHGMFVLRVSATVDQAFAVATMVDARRPVEVHAIVGGEVVLPSITSRVKARPNGSRVELACILG